MHTIVSVVLLLFLVAVETTIIIDLNIVPIGSDKCQQAQKNGIDKMVNCVFHVFEDKQEQMKTEGQNVTLSLQDMCCAFKQSETCVGMIKVTNFKFSYHLFSLDEIETLQVFKVTVIKLD